MNWPDWNDDRSYNNDGLDRRTFYNCNSIPDHWVNGQPGNANWNYPPDTTMINAYANEMTTSGASAAAMDMTATYTVDTAAKMLNVSVTVTPHFNGTGNYHVYIAANDKHYQNIDNEWGQLDYYHVMRTMFPNGNGTAVTSWSNGVPQTFTYSKAYTSTDWTLATSNPGDSSLYPAQLSNTFWNNPLTGSEVVAFVQADNSMDIMQSVAALPPATAVHNVSTLVSNVSVYPNPASDYTQIVFDLANPANVNIQIIDAAGRTITNGTHNMGVGEQKIKISTANYAPGNYNVEIATDNGVVTKRFSVVK